MQKLTISTLLIAISSLYLISCNTTIGLARDMRVIGTEIEKKAESTYKGGSSNEYGGAPVY